MLLYSEWNYSLNNHIYLFSLILRAGSVNFDFASIYGHLWSYLKNKPDLFLLHSDLPFWPKVYYIRLENSLFRFWFFVDVEASRADFLTMRPFELTFVDLGARWADLRWSLTKAVNCPLSSHQALHSFWWRKPVWRPYLPLRNWNNGGEL